MARIFISYSRVDDPFLKDLLPLLTRVFPAPEHTFWYDQHITGGDDWWDTILREIAASTVFIYLLSADSMASTYCQAEFREALRLRKRILPVIVRLRADQSISKLPADLETEIRKREWVNLGAGVRDVNAMATLYAALTQMVGTGTPTPLPPLHPEPTPKPPVLDKKRDWTMPAALIGAAAVILAALIGILPQLLRSDPGSTSGVPTAPTTQVGQIPTTPVPPVTDTVAAPAATAARTDTPTATLDVVQIVATLDAQASAAARLTQIVATTQAVIDATGTATMWTLTPTSTLTPTPNMTASIDAFLATRAAATSAHIMGLTQTATLWTRTPTPTPTPIPVITVNRQWTPQERDVSGVTMMVVPPGCFTIGSNNGDDDEKNGNRICFNSAFLIDKTEVTQAQFRQFGGSAANSPYFTGDDRPVEQITWFEARDFCAKRGARLPTEAEWEYAARGPDGVEYPWGAWDPKKTVWKRGSEQGTANVGSIPEGASWAGALDMSGNVWEWTSSMYKPYPYDAKDNRESASDINSARVLRGGSWVSINVSYLRGADRGRDAPDGGSRYDGFRCARSLS